MDYCPVFLKKYFKSPKSGLTIIELLIVIAILAILVLFALVALNPQAQMSKAKDAQRKSDLSKLKNVLEDYYNDYGQYPDSLTCGEEMKPYLDKIPCDPETETSYLYSASTSPTSYLIYTTLTNPSDPSIDEIGCSEGCGPGCAYNYGASSPNVDLTADCTEGECEGVLYSCQRPEGQPESDGVCNVSTLYSPTYCDDDTCGGNCPSG